VVVPVGSNVNEVDVGTLAKSLVTIGTVVDVGRHQALLAQELVALLGALILIVAKSNNLNTGDTAETDNCTVTTHTKTNERYANCLDWSNSKIKNVFLTCRALRSLNYDSTFVPMPFCRGRKRLSL
jgi:hypothetical protein